MLRSIGAVVAGYVAMAVAVLVVVGLGAWLLVDDPAAPGTAYLAFNLGVGLVAAALGGWVTWRLAARGRMKHVVALAVLVLALGLGMAFGAEPAPGQPSWYPVVISIFGAAGVVAGGMIGDRGAAGSPTEGRSS